MNRVSTYDKLGLPKEVSRLIFILSIVALLSPHVGAVDFGVFKVPQFNNSITQALKIIGPLLMMIAFGCYIPVWHQTKEAVTEQDDAKFKYAKQLLCRTEAPDELIRGVRLLLKLAALTAYMRREIIECIATFLRTTFPQISPVEPKFLPVLESALKGVTSVARFDENSFCFDIDLHQMRIQDIDLTKSNFSKVSLWGCQFHNVILSHSSFAEADLGGTIFNNCSLEYADFTAAKLCGSFMDGGRPTRLINTRLWGANLRDAEIQFCELHNFDSIDLDSLQQKINEGKLRIIQVEP